VSLASVFKHEIGHSYTPLSHDYLFRALHLLYEPLSSALSYFFRFNPPLPCPIDQTFCEPSTLPKNLWIIRRFYLLSSASISSHSPELLLQYGSSTCLEWPKQGRKTEMIRYPLSSSLLILVISLLHHSPTPMDLTLF
jgi:hypothetical protein